jgi:hypothetical protein
MKDKRYVSKTFRLSDTTIINLAKIKEKQKKSYNMLFVEFINNYAKLMETKKESKVFDQELKQGDVCPSCGYGIMKIKHSRYGEFLGCDDFPNCAYKRDIKSGPLDVGQAGYRE